MNARRTALSMMLTIMAASSTLANGAEEAGRHPRRRLTGPDPSEFKIDKLKDLCLDTALVKGGRANVTIIKPDCQCRKLWAKRLPSPPTVINALPARGPRQTQILIGCEDGGVLVLAIPSVGDRRSPNEWAGTPIHNARLTGSPTDIVTLETGASIIAILATDTGQVAGYRF